MNLKIFHIADVHIGMKFGKYPDGVKENLIEARFKALSNAVDAANERHADLLTLGGDLFESLSVKHKDIDGTLEILSGFHGNEVLVLPGNHDFYNEGRLELWNYFVENQSDRIRLLHQYKKTEIIIREKTLAIYPCPCDQQKSKDNRLQWVKNEVLDPDKINILMAHGALIEISPDLNQQYFSMSLGELQSLGMDLCLLGHTHVPYPMMDRIEGERIFNPGTPEPDGMNYKYGGNGFFIEVDQSKNVMASRVPLGTYRFIDTEIKIDDQMDSMQIMEKINANNPENTLVRIALKGYVSQEEYSNRGKIYKTLQDNFEYMDILDDQLKIRLTRELLATEYKVNSLPYEFLNHLLEEEDAMTAHLAYELLQEVGRHD